MSMAIVGAIAAPLIIGGITAGIMNNKAKNMQFDVIQAQGDVDDAIDNRQAVIDTSDDIRAMKAQLTNAYANLGVAVKSAEIQQQQTDVALANMMEGIVQTGVGGNATALAQAAAKSKQGIAATIEQQEVQNQKLYAQGEAQLQAQKMQLEQTALQAEVDAWSRTEEREIFDINRLQAEADFLRNQQQAYTDAATAAWMQGATGSASVAGAWAGSGNA